MKVWFIENYMSFYYILLAVCLIGIDHFIKRSKFDERRKSRRLISKIRINNRLKSIGENIKNEEYDDVFEEVGLNRYIKSEWYNGTRLLLYSVSVVCIALDLILGIKILTLEQSLICFGIGISMIPKKPYPAYYVLSAIQKSHDAKRGSEVYQLYNDIKAEYLVKGDQVGNVYHLLIRLLPYYDAIKPTIQKILPYLQRQETTKAWDIFAKQINIKEAENLATIMKDIEKISIEDSVLILENKQEEFANNLYNTYKDYLRRRRVIVTTILLIGAMSVFKYEMAVFMPWYRDIVSIGNNF